MSRVVGSADRLVTRRHRHEFFPDKISPPMLMITIIFKSSPLDFQSIDTLVVIRQKSLFHILRVNTACIEILFYKDGT